MSVLKQMMAAALGMTAAFAFVIVAEASAKAPTTAAPALEEYVCTERHQLRHADRCGLEGPAAELETLARRGLYPRKPLPTLGLDADLAYLPFSYIRPDNGSRIKLYSSPSDAKSAVNATRDIEPGFNFLSWIECSVYDGAAVYMIAPGVYARGSNDCSQIATSIFSGMQFYRTPDRPFAWILGGSFTSNAPGHDQPTNDRWVTRYEIVEIFDSEEVGEFVWYKIGADQWIEARLVAKVEPDMQKPEDVNDDRWIMINLFEQTVSAYENGELVYATVASTGLPGWWTQPGTFQVEIKMERDDMTGSFEADRSDFYYLEDVPWVMYFDQSRAIHFAYWHNGFGYPRSHGCVNLSPTDANWIFNWAEEGTFVHVWDPSGKTPTDAELYGAGGA